MRCHLGGWLDCGNTIRSAPSGCRRLDDAPDIGAVHKTQLASAADAAHAFALEIYRFTSRWPECERDGLTFEVRRAARDLSICLTGACRRGRYGKRLRTAEVARGKLSKLAYLIRFGTDLGYRKLSSGTRVDEKMLQLEVDLDLLTWEARDDPDPFMIGGIVQESAPSAAGRKNDGKFPGRNHRVRRGRRDR